MQTATTIESAVQFDREYQDAQRLAADALERRNQAVLEVLLSGVRQSELAVALGITPGRVSQIAAAAQRRVQLDGPDLNPARAGLAESSE